MANGGPKENIKRSEECRRARLAFVCQPAPHSEATGKRLCEDYETRDDLLKALPDLILRHNLYGIDIDSRACQIAALALWLLAQRAYLALGLKPIERPPITKTNIVCAEPMPGEIDMLREFTAGLTPNVLGQFFDYLTDDEFWTRAENDIAEALELYARQAENGQPFQRRLFADDTIQGFAFVDICQKRYDVVLMNPPFGDASIPSKDYIEEVYGDTKGDVYKTFIECFQDRLVPCGMLGMISSSAGFFLAQSTDWRERIVLRLYRPHLMADLCYGMLDAMVETAAYVLRSISEEENRQLTLSILSELRTVPTDREGAFSIPTYQQHRRGLKRHQVIQELTRLKKMVMSHLYQAITPDFESITSVSKGLIPQRLHRTRHSFVSECLGKRIKPRQCLKVCKA